VVQLVQHLRILLGVEQQLGIVVVAGGVVDVCETEERRGEEALGDVTGTPSWTTGLPFTLESNRWLRTKNPLLQGNQSINQSNDDDDGWPHMDTDMDMERSTYMSL
jgi:hypothetical protein